MSGGTAWCCVRGSIPSDGLPSIPVVLGANVMLRTSPRSPGLIWLSLLVLVGCPPPATAQPPGFSGPQLNIPNGVSVNTPAAFAGYTLIAPMNSTSTYLVDLEGRIVNEWKSDYTPALSAYLLENGHLLRPGAERGFGGGPGAGGRLQEFNWEGELVWDYSFGDSQLRPHHDICRLPMATCWLWPAIPKPARKRSPPDADRKLSAINCCPIAFSKSNRPAGRPGKSSGNGMPGIT